MKKEELIRKVQEDRKYNEAVLALVDQKYHHYFLPIERSVLVAKFPANLDEDLKKLGYYVLNQKTYLKTSKLYLTVAGKLHMFTDWVEQNGYYYSIENFLFEFTGKPFFKTVITVTDKEGRIIRKAESTVPVNIGGSGVDETNPFENAETSAVGRALSFLGIGQISGIASFEEVADAIERSSHEEEEQEPSKKASSKNPKLAVINKYTVNKFEVLDETRGIIKVTDENGEVFRLYVWGEPFQKIKDEAIDGATINAKIQPAKTRTGEEILRLVDFKLVDFKKVS